MRVLSLNFRVLRYPVTTVLVTSGLFLVPSTVTADTLREVLTSPEMEEVVRVTKENQYRIKRKKLDRNRWFNPKSNFGRLFEKNNQAQNMIGWLAPETGKYKVRQVSGEKTKTYAYGEARLRLNKDTLVFLKAYVPHPKYVEMMEFGLLPVFNDLHPTQVKTALKERIKIDEYPGTLYQEVNGNCTLVLESHRHSRIQLFQRECVSLNTLIEVARTLDLVRFRQKLGEEPERVKRQREDSFFGAPPKKKSNDLPPIPPKPQPAEFVYN